MTKRLEGKTAIIVGGGQQPGETVGNGRATAITFAREGAKVLLVDISETQAKETLAMIEKEFGSAFAGGWILTADITREADCGRGPVDFKFTRGWQVRGLIEVKHISSTQFAHGADTQLPIYLKGKQAPFGIYLSIGYRDRDFEEERIGLVTSTCKAITEQGNTRIVPVFVDARPKKSASKA